ncbi:hypothetical protein F5Y04DRAFT_290980 [Hypomontagnella monticulosa]|nr:hypothetical protein F5Y04DRAFT_290980 [Hypomontagnella monticulosa]
MPDQHQQQQQQPQGRSLYGTWSQPHRASAPGPSSAQAPAPTTGNSSNGNGNSGPQSVQQYRTEFVPAHYPSTAASHASSRLPRPSTAARHHLPPPHLNHPALCAELLRQLRDEIRRSRDLDPQVPTNRPYKDKHPRPIFRIPLPTAPFHIMLYLQQTHHAATLDAADQTLWDELALLARLGVHSKLRLLPSGGFAARFLRVKDIRPSNGVLQERHEVRDTAYWSSGVILERGKWDAAHAAEIRAEKAALEAQLPLWSEMSPKEKKEVWEGGVKAKGKGKEKATAAPAEPEEDEEDEEDDDDEDEYMDY